MSWTPDRVKKLKELWNSGHTASQIATRLGQTTRNAVIGKAHRLKLEGRVVSKGIKPKNKTQYTENKRTKVSRRSKFKSLLLDKNFEPENPKTLEELNDYTCKWPIGHPDKTDFYFCGRKRVEDFSYCKLHVLYAFQPKHAKQDTLDKDEEIPKFIENKIKSA